eukprot:4608134-Pleurochrysis_carterae.AAC.2
MRSSASGPASSGQVLKRRMGVRMRRANTSARRTSLHSEPVVSSGCNRMPRCRLWCLSRTQHTAAGTNSQQIRASAAAVAAAAAGLGSSVGAPQVLCEALQRYGQGTHAVAILLRRMFRMLGRAHQMREREP